MSAGYYEEDYDAPPESIWQRINRWLWALLVLTVVAIVISAFLPELQKQRTERDQRERLHRLIEEQKTLHSINTRKIGWLQNDPEYLAIIARDRLNLMKEGETILLAPPEPESTPGLVPQPEGVPPGMRLKMKSGG